MDNDGDYGYRQYHWPKIKDCEKFSVQEQMAKVNEETYELQREVLKDKRDRRWILFEGMNVIHAVETLFRTIGATEYELVMASEETIYENRLRGYYDEQ